MSPDRASLVCVLEPDAAFRAYLREMLLPHVERLKFYARASQLKRAVSRERPDLVICELVLADQDGPSLLRWLRSKYPLLALLVISSRQMPLDRVTAVKAGADAFLAKPLQIDELLAYLQAFLRRSLELERALAAVQSQTQAEQASELFQAALGDLKLSLEGQAVLLSGHQAFRLTSHELALLKLLAHKPNQILSRRELIKALWPGKPLSSRVLDTYIARLRRILNQAQKSGCKAPQIETLHGFGYCLRQAASQDAASSLDA